MSRIRSTNTKPELIIRKQLYKRGYRYRLHFNVTGKPDIVFPKRKIAIFVNGCFWHLHGCSNSSIPKSNTEFWRKKLETNKSRDEKFLEKLNRERWIVKVLWECEIEKDLENVIKDLIYFIDSSSSQ